jgi:hypothetical protein
VAVSEARFNLRSLPKLGIDPATLRQIRTSIDRSSDESKVHPDLSVPLSVLIAHAKKLGHKNLVPSLEQALKLDVSGPPLVTTTDPAAFAKPELSWGPAKTLSATPASIPAGALAPWSAKLDQWIAGLVRDKKLAAPLDLGSKDGIPAETMQRLLFEHGYRMRTELTLPELEKLFSVACAYGLPAHLERDAELRIDSVYRQLTEGAGGKVRVLQKNQWEGLSVQRTAGADGAPGFKIHGFKTDRIVVTLPKDHSLIVVDSTGNECAPDLPRTTAKVGGEELGAIEISRSLLGNPGLDRNLRFAIKVLDPQGNAVFQQALGFDKPYSSFSETLFEGRFGYQSHDASNAFDRWRLDYGQVSGANKVPLGRRPRFELGEEADRLQLRRDGKSFAVQDLHQLLGPPRRRPQTYASTDQARVFYTVKEDYSVPLDETRDHDRLGPYIRASNGDSVTFDRDLHLTHQARFGIGGVTIVSLIGQQKAFFDPLDLGAAVGHKSG